MNNEADLDWLARNVHEWPEGRREVLVCWPRNVDTLIWSYVLSDAGWINKDQWLARRAELQNKPCWKDAPEWATSLTQDSAMEDGLGACWWHEFAPTECERTWSSQGRAYPAKERGEVLGDWLDTLELRPEAMTATVSQEDLGHLGMKADHGKPILGAIPPHAELAVGRVLTFGAEKYARGNWDHVVDHENRYMDAAMRHLNAHRRGELVDGESGESHLAHAACCILFLLDKQERAGGV